MAKNKNSRKQPTPQDKASQQSEKSSSFEAPAQPPAQGSPADVARKHQRRFGHN
ncbi:hypothetical protein ACH4SP_17355 [Streptomyces sp. NPDC021093]|uniref:hypothetical protein n=1 Tax=Streptomyces sp. NPDC021093 TaxID=3365112 RepID=UPI0037AD5221